MEPNATRLLSSLLRFRRINWTNVFSSNLNMSQISVLLTLAEYSLNEENNNVIMSDLSKKCKITRPALTQIINGLEKEGLVKRTISAQNRREILVEATEEGLVVARKQKDKIFDFFSELTMEMGYQDTEMFINLLDKFFSLINENNIDKE